MLGWHLITNQIFLEAANWFLGHQFGSSSTNQIQLVLTVKNQLDYIFLVQLRVSVI